MRLGAFSAPLVVGLVACGAVALTPRVAAAQATDRVLAEALFREGRELMEQNKLAEACSKFAESYRLDRALGTLINLALCHEKDGKIGTAWAELTDAAAEAAAEKDDREGLARRHLAILEHDLPRLRLVVAPATATLASLEIQLDGHAIGKAGWAMPLPIDPGDHVVRATAEGKRSFETKVVVPKGLGLTDANVPELEDAPKPIVVPPPPPPSNEPPPSHTQKTVGYIVGGAGVVGALVGAAFGFSAISLKGDRDARCNAQGTLCDREGLDKDASARSAATASTIAFIAGGALLAGGAVLVFTAPKQKKSVQVGFSSTNLFVGGAF